MQGELHIWKAFISGVRSFSTELIASLSEEEKSRGRRFVKPKDQERFLLARGVLRDVLSRYVGRSAEEIKFKDDSNGKPFVVDSSFQFNLSHSEDCVLIAVADGVQVGVDVEYTGRHHEFDDLVARFFSSEEREEYFRYEGLEERRLAFYRGWTRKEAYLKAVGVGLSFPLDQFSVSLAFGEKQVLCGIEQTTGANKKWAIFSVAVADDYVGSVAIPLPFQQNCPIYSWAAPWLETK